MEKNIQILDSESLRIPIYTPHKDLISEYRTGTGYPRLICIYIN